MNAWTTTIISGLVFVVTFMQWRTAHTRILLDLFDKRSVAYNGVVDSMRPAFRDGTLQDMKDFWALRKSIDDAFFLFGDDVRVLLKELVRVGATLSTASGVMKNPENPEYHVWVDRNHQAIIRLEEISNEMAKLMEEYLGFSERRLPSLGAYLAKRNNIRLSYADEKQK